MTLYRAAFETDSNVVLFTVLCAGCFQGILDKGEARHWVTPLNSGECEFCLDEVRHAAGS